MVILEFHIGHSLRVSYGVWVVLTIDALYILESEKANAPIDAMRLRDIASIKSPMNKSGTFFITKTDESSYMFKTTSPTESAKWMDYIFGYMNKAETTISIANEIGASQIIKAGWLEKQS